MKTIANEIDALEKDFDEKFPNLHIKLFIRKYGSNLSSTVKSFYRQAIEKLLKDYALGIIPEKKEYPDYKKHPYADFPKEHLGFNQAISEMKSNIDDK